MRSRYCAFCRSHVAYLLATHHPSKRQPDEVQTLQDTINETEWLGLTVLKAPPPKQTDTIGLVEFAAFYKRGDFGQLHERSQFIKENGRWYYLQGELLAPLTLKRNDLCWCGSRKKYKRCHGQ
jgi:SEC-C motif-containing protein